MAKTAEEIRKLLKLSTKVERLPRISTGILSLDLILGGGFPVRRISELYGWSLTGKTYIMLRTARVFLDLNPENLILWFDREGALEEPHLLSLGIDPERFIYVPPYECATVDQLMEHSLKIFESDEPPNIMIAIDSIGAYVKDEKSLTSTSADMGRVAKGVKDYLRKIGPYLDRTESSFILAANHLYLDPNSMSSTPKKSGGTGITFLRTCGLALQATRESEVTNPDLTGFFLFAVADKTRMLKGDKPSKTVLYLDKGGKGIHPLSGLSYFLAVWGKYQVGDKNKFRHPSAAEHPTVVLPKETVEKLIRFRIDTDYEKELRILKEYGPALGVPDWLITKAEEYIQKYNFHHEGE